MRAHIFITNFAARRRWCSMLVEL